MAGHAKASSDGVDHAAHTVLIGHDRRIVVSLDGQDGTGSYPEDAGTLEVEPGSTVTITASF